MEVGAQLITQMSSRLSQGRLSPFSFTFLIISGVRDLEKKRHFVLLLDGILSVLNCIE